MDRIELQGSLYIQIIHLRLPFLFAIVQEWSQAAVGRRLANGLEIETLAFRVSNVTLLNIWVIVTDIAEKMQILLSLRQG